MALKDEDNIEPSLIVANGHDEKGRFAPGNKLGKGGNTFAAQMNKFRAAVLRSIADESLVRVTEAVVRQAEDGNLKAAQLLFEITGVRVKQIEATIEDGSQKTYVSLAIEKV
jgi:hypothetical protein